MLKLLQDNDMYCEYKQKALERAKDIVEKK